MLRNGWWIALAIVLASVAAGVLLGAEFAATLILPDAEPLGATPAVNYWLVLLLVIFAALAWALGLTVLGIPTGMALRRIGRDGYVSAMLAGAIGGFVALLIVLVVFSGFPGPAVLFAYPALMVIPGAAAGLIVRRVAYRPGTSGPGTPA
jgi:hypothetical protein